MKEEIKRKVLLVTICIITLAILVIAIRLNENRKQDELSTSKISNYLTEIKYEDVKSYVVEEPDAIVYVSNSSDDSTREFNDIFIPVIKEYNLENNIIFININNEEIDDAFYQNAPELIFYKESLVSDVIDVSTLSTSNDLKKILKERSVIGD